VERSRFGSIEGQNYGRSDRQKNSRNHAEPQSAQHGADCRTSSSSHAHSVPIAFFVATFCRDIVFMKTMDTGGRMATQWLLGAGLVMAALAALAGLTDFLGDHRIRKLNAAWLHAGGQCALRS
jgi:hypothetical protein